VRAKVQWPAFKSSNPPVTIGLKGFRGVGYHEKQALSGGAPPARITKTRKATSNKQRTLQGKSPVRAPKRHASAPAAAPSQQPPQPQQPLALPQQMTTPFPFAPQPPGPFPYLSPLLAFNFQAPQLLPKLFGALPPLPGQPDGALFAHQLPQSNVYAPLLAELGHGSSGMPAALRMPPMPMMNPTGGAVGGGGERNSGEEGSA